MFMGLPPLPPPVVTELTFVGPGSMFLSDERTVLSYFSQSLKAIRIEPRRWVGGQRIEVSHQVWAPLLESYGVIGSPRKLCPNLIEIELTATDTDSIGIRCTLQLQPLAQDGILEGGEAVMLWSRIHSEKTETNSGWKEVDRIKDLEWEAVFQV